jgi:hypothetical protein
MIVDDFGGKTGGNVIAPSTGPDFYRLRQPYAIGFLTVDEFRVDERCAFLK